jgi:putative nucleotidyltransferase with HDIG domain
MKARAGDPEHRSGITFGSLFGKPRGAEMLCGSKDLEIISYAVREGASFAFGPAHDALPADSVLFIYVCSGTIRVSSDSRNRVLAPGDFAWFSDVGDYTRFSAETDASLLLIANDKIFASLKERVDRIYSLHAGMKGKDGSTGEHLKRVSAICRDIAYRLSLQQRQVTALIFAAYFHDIGKIEVPDAILKKPGPLDPGELQVMREHVSISADIFAREFGNDEGIEPERVREIIYRHHERLDGSGYPEGVTADDIPIEARILAAVDSFDAMTSDRPYSKALSPEDAIELLKYDPSGYDPEVVAALADAVEARLKEYEAAYRSARAKEFKRK